MCNWVAWWFNPNGRDDPGAVTDQLAVGALHRAEGRAVDGDGPAAALKLLRQNLDRLERVLDGRE